MGFSVNGQFRDGESHPIPDQMYVKYGSKNQPSYSNL